MKLNKKFLSCFTAATLAVAPMTAFAAPESYDIIGEGTVTYLDSEVYNVILPTSETIAFKVDPSGILSAENGDSLTDYLTDAAGIVTSSATAVINKSSVDVSVDVEMFFDSTKASNSSVTLGTKAEVESGSKDLYLAVQQLSGATLDKASVITDAATTLTGSAVSGNAFTLSTAALTISNTVDRDAVSPVAITVTNAALSGTTMSAVLSDIAGAYYITGDATNANTKVAVLDESKVSYASGNVFAFEITGAANPNSDIWEQIADDGGDLALTMKFTIDKAPDYVTAHTFLYNGTLYIAKAAFSGKTSPNPGFTGTTVTNVTVNGNAGTATVKDGYVTISSSLLTNTTGNNVIMFECSDGNTYKAIQ